MGTLTMALAAALLAGRGLEKVSEEVEERPELRGNWEGTCNVCGVTFYADLAGETLCIQNRKWNGQLRMRLVDTGMDKILVKLAGSCFGIGTCRLDKGIVIISFPEGSLIIGKRITFYLQPYSSAMGGGR